MKKLYSPLILLTTSLSYSQLDLNNNGYSDVLETLHPEVFSAPLTIDSDQDGMSDLDEIQSLTDPNDSTDSLRILDIEETATSYIYDFPTREGINYTSEYSSDLENWSTLNISTAGDGASKTIVIPKSSFVNEPKVFFRVCVNGYVDTDNDNIPDWEEELLGFSATDSNSVRSASAGGDEQHLVNLLTGANPMGGLAGGGSAGVPSDEHASRFLAQSTFGPRLDDIEDLQALGNNSYEKWIDQQLALPKSYLSPYINYLINRRQLDYDNYNNGVLFTPWKTVDTSLALTRVPNSEISTPWMRLALFAPDQLRQRAAHALSQIIVVGRRDAGFALASTDFYDLIIDHAFGDFEDLLYEASVHPLMGWWLSSLGNQKEDPSINRTPDENYAREIMQLFTIGLFELNMDGSNKLDSNGEPIPTYDINDIKEMARVFTGLWHQNTTTWGTNPPNSAEQVYLADSPMLIYPTRHDTAAKTLLNGVVLPAHSADPGRDGYKDIRDACSSLVNHPTCPPFISKQLIQFLVTSNPSPAYVERIANVFVNDGNGSRGNLGAVIKAILLDAEARSAFPDLQNEGFGQLREPMVRTTNLARATEAGSSFSGLHDDTGVQYWTPDGYDNMLQFPLSPPSVFNYYEPGYSRPGEVINKGLVSPKFQILNSYTATAAPNLWWSYLTNSFHQRTAGNTPSFTSTFASSSLTGFDLDALCDEVSLLIANGRLRADSRNLIKSAVSLYTDSTDGAIRKKTAYYLTLVSPEAAILK